jgi:putative CocE/NonD family hydrolase
MHAGGVVVERNVMVPMRDGVRLATDVYRPDEPGRLPVLLQRLPYGKEILTDIFLPAAETAARGYVVVCQDCRGRYDSEGEFYPFHCEIEDGYDAIEWAAAQPWSNGRVGTFGGSYLGATQWLAAIAEPPHLVAMAPLETASDFYDHWVYHSGGAFCLLMSIGWPISIGADTMRRLREASPVGASPDEALERLLARSEEHRRSGLLTLDPTAALTALQAIEDQIRPYWAYRPIRELPALNRLYPWFADWVDHPEPDAYWQRVNVSAHYDRVRVPALHATGWYEQFLPGGIGSFLGMRRHGATEQARRGQKLVIGPWIHSPFSPATTSAGDLDFGPQAGIELVELQWRWFDHWLKGIDTGLLDEPPVRIFVMGDNVWRDEQEWPLARTRWTPYYLHSSGSANTRAGDGTLSPEPPAAEPPDRFAYDPADPVPTRGGAHGSNGRAPGSFDQAEVEARPDVLVYTTAPLTEDVEVTGPVAVELWASSSALDTDFTAKLVDVYPDGRAMNVCDGVVRARYRASPGSPRLLRPGAVYGFAIDLWATSNVFKAGHRIRLQISSSNFPHLDPNPNTGHVFGRDDETAVAEQHVFHDALHPSHVVLPVVPRG